MEAIKICQNLRVRVSDFKDSDLFKKSKPLQYDILAIEIAINLCELALLHNRNIEESEKIWFTAGYYIAMDFTGVWEDISKLYDEMVKTIKVKL